MKAYIARQIMKTLGSRERRKGALCVGCIVTKRFNNQNHQSPWNQGRRTHVLGCMWVYVSVCVHVCQHLHWNQGWGICVYMCVFVCAYIFACVHIYVHVCNQLPWNQHHHKKSYFSVTSHRMHDENMVFVLSYDLFVSHLTVDVTAFNSQHWM
jgi:hypothetical protein